MGGGVREGTEEALSGASPCRGSVVTGSVTSFGPSRGVCCLPPHRSHHARLSPLADTHDACDPPLVSTDDGGLLVSRPLAELVSLVPTPVNRAEVSGVVWFAPSQAGSLGRGATASASASTRNGPGSGRVVHRLTCSRGWTWMRWSCWSERRCALAVVRMCACIGDRAGGLW